MAYTLKDHRNDAIKYSKLMKWNHEPQASGFTAKLRSYAPTGAMRLDDDDDDDDDKSVYHGKL